jgi:hypothetical protein
MPKYPPVPLPPDIAEFVEQLFDDRESARKVMEVIAEFHARKRGLNVPPSQFCRAIICLSAGATDEFDRLASIPEDPRDILMMPRRRFGVHETDFAGPFSFPLLKETCNQLLDKNGDDQG